MKIKMDKDLEIANIKIKKKFGKRRYKIVNSIDKIQNKCITIEMIIHHRLFCIIIMKMMVMYMKYLKQFILVIFHALIMLLVSICLYMSLKKTISQFNFKDKKIEL